MTGDAPNPNTPHPDLSPTFRVYDSIAEIAAQDWNRLAGTQPFLQHAFLRALEDSECASLETGWTPQHMTLWLGTYLVGFLVVILGLAFAAYLLNAPPMWIAVGVIVLVGLGIVMATTRTRPKDPV